MCRGPGNIDLATEKRDAAVGVHHAVLPETEDVMRPGIGLGEYEMPEEAIPLPLGAGKSDTGDFTRGRMDLMVVVACCAATSVAIHLFTQDGAGFFEGGEVLQGACPDDAILHPAVRAFDLALGLR